MDTENASESIQSAEVIKPRSFFSRLGGVFASPRSTFQEVDQSPGILVPIIALVILSMLSIYLLSLKVDLGELQSQAIEQAMDQRVAQGSMTQEQANQMSERLAGRTGGAITSVVTTGLAAIVIVLIIAAIAKLFSATFLGVENRFKALFSVTMYVFLAVGIVQTLLFLVVLYFKDPADLSAANVNSLVASNLGALLTGILGEDALPRFLAKFLGWVDIFAIWKIALLAIGYSAVSHKLKTARAATWITGVYLVIALVAAAIAPIFGQ